MPGLTWASIYLHKKASIYLTRKKSLLAMDCGSSPAMTAACHRVTCADTASHFPCNGEANFQSSQRLHRSLLIRGIQEDQCISRKEQYLKKLQLTLPGQNSDGSRTEPSGRGYFPGRWKWLPSPGRAPARAERQRLLHLIPFTGIIGASHQT